MAVGNRRTLRDIYRRLGNLCSKALGISMIRDDAYRFRGTNGSIGQYGR